MQNFHPFVSNFIEMVNYGLSSLILLLGTASYRLMPEIILKKPVYDEDAEQLQKCFTQGVIELEHEKNGMTFFFCRLSIINQKEKRKNCFLCIQLNIEILFALSQSND